MKNILLLFSVPVFAFLISCEKEEVDTKPSALALDLQNGYWEVDFGVSINVMKFEINTMNAYWIEGTPPCITESGSQSYSIEGNSLTMPSAENPLLIDIQGDVLTLTDEIDQFQIEFGRKSTFDYTDC